MKTFNDPKLLTIVDPQNTLQSTDMLIEQSRAAWSQVTSLSLPSDLNVGITNIVFCGMGASIYGALVLKALEGNQLPYPIEVVSDYHLPSYVSKSTLVVLTSYSGSTEEVLSCAEEAKEKGAKMVVLTKGGKLCDFAKENNVPAYIFDGTLNSAGVPRLGAGYTIFGLLGLLDKVGIVTIDEREIENSITRMQEKVSELKTRAATDSQIFLNTVPIVFAAEHLGGNAQILRNQFNETSKTFSAFYLVPDLNHHLMEGLQFPKTAKLHFIILNSPNYTTRIKKRMTLTMDVLKQNNRPYTEIMMSGQTLYDDYLEAMIYGSYITLFLALRRDINPAPNPWVDYFKEQLGK